jgi:hypothetical protein
VPRAALRLLQNGLRAEIGHYGADFLGLMSYDNEQLCWSQRLANAYYVFYERASPGAMQHFGEIGTHARPFPGG